MGKRLAVRAVTASHLYSPYGSVRYARGILPTDLDDDNAHWYDPLVGQFTSSDTTLAGG
jgi:hypothetical protein